MLLEIKNIKKYFPLRNKFLSSHKSYVRAVDDISLTVGNGENISLVGESGCGKTTLARIIIQLIASDSGSIIFEGKDISLLKKKELKGFRKYMQMVFQDPYSSLDPRFTIRNIIKEAMTLDKEKYPLDKDKEERIRELILAVNLDAKILDRYPHEFSGGERQRIAIARALVMNPKLLILDEAVSALDVIIQNQLIQLLMDLQQKFHLTYLFISHNLKVVRKLSQKIAVMYKGKIIEMAKTEDIFNNPLHPYTKELLSAALEFKSVRNSESINIPHNASLVDQGGGHFVLS